MLEDDASTYYLTFSPQKYLPYSMCLAVPGRGLHLYVLEEGRATNFSESINISKGKNRLNEDSTLCGSPGNNWKSWPTACVVTVP